MKRDKKQYVIAMNMVLGVIMLASCSEDIIPSSIYEDRMAISIQSVYPSLQQDTRISVESGFVADDQVGIFVVDYDTEGQPGIPTIEGNRASNLRYTLQTNGSWLASKAIFWADKNTPADFYGYYPYNEGLTSLSSYSFSVSADQDTESSTDQTSGYAVSDLLWACSKKVMPTTETINLQYQHLMSCVTIRLEPGDGFSENEWKELEKTVLVQGTTLDGTVNLQTGEVSVGTGLPKAIVPLFYQNAWRCIVFPQTVAVSRPLVSVTIDGQSYSLQKTESVNFSSGKMYTFTIKVNRRSPSGDFELMLSDESISPWLDDSQLHEGLVRQYVVVELEKEGTLKEMMAKMRYDYLEVSNLKVKGRINHADLNFMGQEMKHLTNVNLREATLEGNDNERGVITGFNSHQILQHIVFPEKSMTTIGEYAFAASGLMGSLEIPEGVTLIDEDAFNGCNFTGTLSLPSTLKIVRSGGGAFAGNHFTGELRLPEGLEDIGIGWGGEVFSGNDFSGPLTLPRNLKKMCPLGFSKMTGDIIIPDSWTEIPDLDTRGYRGVFAYGGFDGTVSIPEGITYIGNHSFYQTKICGEVKIPASCKGMGDEVFCGTRINRLILPENLASMGKSCFAYCERLAGTITWPKKILKIPVSTFENCVQLSGVILHENVSSIGNRAFYGCVNLQSIIIENEEPPLVGTDAFIGVPKGDLILQVPESSVELYRQADGWNDFRRIVAHSNFDCQPRKVCALNRQHKEELVIYADDEWTVTHLPKWCSLSQMSGTGKTELSVTIQQLPHGQEARCDSIVFQTNKNYTTWCTLNQFDYEYDEDNCLTLQTHGKGHGIDIVFAGDGYDGASIADGTYLDLVKYQTECFFAIEPYKSMRDYFNVYVTFPLSQEAGVNTMNTYVNNRFGTLHGQSSLSEGQQCTSNDLITQTDELEAYVLKYSPLTSDRISNALIILVPNTTDYSSSTILNERDNRAISICPPSVNAYPRDTRGVIQHEAGGHGFGKLGDETIIYSGWISDQLLYKIMYGQSRGWFQNLSTTGKLNSVPWFDFVYNTKYSDHVDVYEGGYGYMRGIYRPEVNSCMNYGIPYYNSPSRYAIWCRIKQYAGEDWSLDEFQAQDTFEWGTTNVAPSATRVIGGEAYTKTNRHSVPKIVNFKKMGQEVRHIREQLKRK